MVQKLWRYAITKSGGLFVQPQVGEVVQLVYSVQKSDYYHLVSEDYAISWSCMGNISTVCTRAQRGGCSIVLGIATMYYTANTLQAEPLIL